ncbi:MAG: T9SS type A sorting domain-containing protein, partial [Flavobacteriales bacterium]
VESPCMDFSALSVDPVFRFAYLAQTESGWDGAWVEVSTDAGLTWTNVGVVGEGTNWYNAAAEHPGGDWWEDELGAPSSYLTATHLLDGAAGESSVKVRVRFSSDVSGTFEGFAFDDIEIFEQPSINAGVVEILSPVSGCGLATELVTVVMQNFGDADLVDFLAGYNAGAGDVTELVTDTLFAASVDTFTFATPVDLSVLGNYNFAAYTAAVGDGDLLNDSLFTSVFSSPVVSSLPYMEDFELGPGGWYSNGENGVWELGDPEGILIDTAASGVNAWATNLNDTLYALDQLSYLISPCFDLSNLTIDPILEFGLIGNSEAAWDGMWLESSIDGGATWTTVGNVGEGENWYNQNAFINPIPQGWDGNTADTVGWVVAEHLLDGVAGSSDVIIRFVFDSDDFVVLEGFGIDDIMLTEQPPVNSELTAIVSPESGCGLTATEEIKVLVSNLGSMSLDSVIVGYTLNNGTPIVEIFNDTIAVGQDSILTLSSTIDLSVLGEYELTVWTGTIGDGDTSNDTVSVVINSIPTISGLPYMQDFESGNGGWVAAGVNSTWELGDPQGTFIDTAFSGVNAWVTNLAGPYVNDEDSWVESPCIDFSNLTADPVLSFAHIYNTESCCDEGWIDLSLDGGATWTKLGAFGEGDNWYNDEFDQLWNGNSGDPTVWRTAEHILDGVAGLSDVKIRFMFSSDGSATFEGFGVDDISIVPQPELDLVALSFDGPESNCELGMEEVSMTFWNKGLMAVSNFDLGFIVDGGTPQTEVYTNTVNSGDTVSYTFTTEMADLSTEGAHVIDVFTALAGDERLESDSLLGNSVTNHGSDTGLEQTVETELALSSTIVEGTTSELLFCGLPTSLDGCLEIESVTIDSITHTFLADLDIFLISPAGDTVELSTDNGGAGDNLSNLVFTDTATNDITLQTGDILPGIYHTEDVDGFAGLYDGQDPNGGWSLFIQDDAGGDDGVLHGWSMTFVDNSPMPVLAYSDTTICLSHVLDLTVEEYDSYLWSTGHNSQTAEVFGDVLGLGTYEVSVTVDQDGCTGVSNSFSLIVDACLGVEELGDLSIDVYPNPSNGQIVLDITGDSEGLMLEVMDVNGKRVYSESTGAITSGLRKTVDLTNLATGMYFLKLDNGTSSTTKKIIKN